MNSLISLICLFLIYLGSIVSILSLREEFNMSLSTLVILTFLESASLGSLTYTLSKLDGETNCVGLMSRKLQLVVVCSWSLLKLRSMFRIPLGLPCFNSSFVRKPLEIMKDGLFMFISPVIRAAEVIEENLDLS